MFQVPAIYKNGAFNKGLSGPSSPSHWNPWPCIKINSYAAGHSGLSDQQHTYQED